MHCVICVNRKKKFAFDLLNYSIVHFKIPFIFSIIISILNIHEYYMYIYLYIHTIYIHIYIVKYEDRERDQCEDR